MSIIGSNILAGAAGSGVSAYEIEQSLRVNRDDSANMSRTFNNGGSSHTQWTFSFWTKRHLKPGTSDEIIFYTNKGSGYSRLDFGSGVGQGVSLIQYNGSGWDYRIFTLGQLRDPSAWYHVVFVYDSPNATESERLRVYINGERQVSNPSTGLTYPSQNFASELGKDATHYLFRGVNYGTAYYNGYAAETYFIDNQALDPTDFGELDNNGVWRPIEYTGTYGGNSFYLQYASSGIGDDSSGEGNNWTPSGFTTSGTGTDVMSDTPTTNWATLNPLDKFNGRWSNSPTNGNLEISIPSDSTLKRNYPGAYSTIEVPTTGKFYFEITPSQQYTNIAVVGTDYIQTVTTGDHIGDASQDSVEYRCSSGDYRWSGSTSASGLGGFTSGNVYGVAVDLGDETFRVYENGIAGSELSISGWTGNGARVTAYVSASTASGAITFNFGQRAFAYTPPTGFKALNTSNLPAPTVKKGSTYFDTVTYSGATSGTAGAGTTQTVTGLGFSPDLVWIKNRSNANSHGLFDQVRGAVNALRSDLTNAEATTNSSGALSAFNSNGFTLANGSSGSDQAILTHQSGYNYVAWAWDANGAGSSNTAGSITSTVSANPSAGFSIVSYTGTGANATVGHGLGVALAMVIVKDRDNANFWVVGHQDLGGTGFAGDYYLRLNGTDAGAVGGGVAWNSTNPTSTVFSIGTSTVLNGSGNDHIAYCFAEVEGYSKFGSYTGNANADGTFIHLGFKPAWLMIKNSNTSGTNWVIFDSVRQTYNVIGPWLMPSSSSQEFDNDYIDFLSNGFKLRVNNTLVNNGTYIFAAFAENPFGGSGVSPACAR